MMQALKKHDVLLDIVERCNAVVVERTLPAQRLRTAWMRAVRLRRPLRSASARARPRCRACPLFSVVKNGTPVRAGWMKRMSRDS